MVNNNLKTILTCKDFTVSNEEFDLVLDQNLEMLITSPQPLPDKLEKYYESEEYISHTDSKKSLFDRIYQLVKTYTISKKIKLVTSFLDIDSQKSILDIGCGTGDFLVASKKKGFNVCGIEPKEKPNSISKSKLEIDIYQDISEINSQKFDIISMWHVLEHVPNLEEYISNLKQLLNPNGTLFVAVPNHKSFDANYYGKFWAAYDVPRHLWHFSQKSIELLFKKEQMKVVKTKPMLFDSFYVSLLSEKYMSGKSNPLKAFFIGLKSNLSAMRSSEYSSLIYVLKNE
ncbi:MAG: class I SAM-dependent methyltransferase [Urechidicola sp.]|nr:class I SAM-dependent methyltransferase [Urechidicola sp.]